MIYNKAELTRKCQFILHKKIMDKGDKQFLHTLIKLHPNYEKKKGCGIKDFVVKPTIYNSIGFFIIRNDGSTTDFSYKQCISPRTKLTKIRLACRSAIRPYIKKFKTDRDKIIHHIKLFSEIVNVWLQTNKNIDLTINKTEDNCQEIFFINQQTINSFIKFHNKMAKIVEISKEEHKLIHNGEKYN